MLEVYTIQINKRHLIADRDDMMFIDTTVKSGISIFAPTWSMVHGVKNGKLSEADYTHHYISMITDKMINDIDVWNQHIPRDGKIVLACYCHANDFCHRHILKNLIIEQYHSQGHLVVDGGEITSVP